MGFTTIVLSLTPYPILSVLLWILMLLSAMYFSRKPFQRAMAACGRMIYASMRLAASAVKDAEKRLQQRNREVLIHNGLEQAEKKVEREFDRIAESARLDLENYPQLQRRLQGEILKLSGDYQKCLEIPQELPDWTKVIEAVAKIHPSGDQVVVTMLAQIHATLNEQHRSAVERHRRDVAERHAILSRMVPVWRGLQRTLAGMENTIARFDQRARRIDRYMDFYEKLRGKDDLTLRQLTCSALTRFFVSGLMLAVAALCALINFNLVAQPISELVGGSGTIGAFKTVDVTGMFMVCLQIALGVLIMDSLCITRFFKAFDGMHEKKRRLVFAGLLTLLVILAGVEALLVLLREHYAVDLQVLRQSLEGMNTQPASGYRLLNIGQMIMGFLLPFVMGLAAIPFESFLVSSRTVSGTIVVWMLRATACTLRLAGSSGCRAARLVTHIFDLIIFPCLWVEAYILSRRPVRCSCDGTLAVQPAVGAGERPRR